jgi:hypothetical protein
MGGVAQVGHGGGSSRSRGCGSSPSSGDAPTLSSAGCYAIIQRPPPNDVIGRSPRVTIARHIKAVGGRGGDVPTCRCRWWLRSTAGRRLTRRRLPCHAHALGSVLPVPSSESAAAVRSGATPCAGQAPDREVGISYWTNQTCREGDVTRIADMPATTTEFGGLFQPAPGMAPRRRRSWRADSMSRRGDKAPARPLTAVTDEPLRLGRRSPAAATLNRRCRARRSSNGWAATPRRAGPVETPVRRCGCGPSDPRQQADFSHR